jgi:hypothetical protein
VSLAVNDKIIVQQTKVESQALKHVTQALEATLGWIVAGDGFARKLSSVRFFTEAYQRHMERLFALEEIDGYMESVSRLNPELTSRVALLKQEHESFRGALRETVLRLDLALPIEVADFERTCAQLQDTINRVLDHLHRESELLVESFDRDTGGEG